MRDDTGRARAILEQAESGGAQLLLLDPEGAVQVALFGTPDGARGLALHDGQSLRAGMTAAPGGAATVALEADGRIAGASMTILPEGTASVRSWGTGAASWR